MIPSRVKVIRLFEKEKIEQEIPPNLPDEWISVYERNPDSSRVFYVKNDRNVFKAIYIHGYPNPNILQSKWIHSTKDEFINKHEITHWMEFDC